MRCLHTEFLSWFIFAIVLPRAKFQRSPVTNRTSGTTTPTASALSPCALPPLILNGFVTSTSSTEGSLATYQCKPGYTMFGSTQKVCRGGMWISTGSEPICTVEYCPNPPAVTNAALKGINSNSNYVVGATAEYLCFSGFLPANITFITCLQNLSWSLPSPICSALDCGPPPGVANGNVSFSSTVYSSEASYTCDSGYELITPTRFSSRVATIRCQATGLWASPPSCTRKDCGFPPSIQHGVRLSLSGHYYSDSAVFGCLVGFTLHGNDTVVCRDTGTWSPLPECVAVVCRNPPAVANATLTSTDTAAYGNTSTYHCDEGFYMTGYNHVTCKADGTWTDPPTCTIQDCRTPPSIHFGKVAWTSSTFKSQAEYKCEEGYVLVGTSVVTCMGHGWWSAEPQCQIPPGSSSSSPSSRTEKGSVGEDNSSAVASLAVACAVLAMIVLAGLAIFGYRTFSSHRSSLFGYAAYTSADDSVNARA